MSGHTKNVVWALSRGWKRKMVGNFASERVHVVEHMLLTPEPSR